MDAEELGLLAEALTKTMTTVPPGGPLYDALVALGWKEMLEQAPDAAVPVVFRLLGETGADAPLLADVMAAGDPVAALAAGRRAVGWWLLGSGRAMLDLARTHALDRVQFGKPIASFQAVRHKLAETLVALDGAEAVLRCSTGPGELPSLLAKAAAGRAALLAAKHCQQVLGGIGFTAEHPLHVHVKRVLVLDGMLGSSRELTREAGRYVIAAGAAPRLVDL